MILFNRLAKNLPVHIHVAPSSRSRSLLQSPPPRPSKPHPIPTHHRSHRRTPHLPPLGQIRPRRPRRQCRRHPHAHALSRHSPRQTRPCHHRRPRRQLPSPRRQPRRTPDRQLVQRHGHHRVRPAISPRPPLPPSHRTRRRPARHAPRPQPRQRIQHRSRRNRLHGLLRRRPSRLHARHAFRRRQSLRLRPRQSRKLPPRLRDPRLSRHLHDRRLLPRGSAENLLGNPPDPALAKSLSNELNVTSSTPPTFLFSTSADTLVPPENTVAFYLALRKANVPAEMHIFEKGPHGVGLALNDVALSEWGTLLRNWLRIRGVLSPANRITNPSTDGSHHRSADRLRFCRGAPSGRPGTRQHVADPLPRQARKPASATQPLLLRSKALSP